MEIDYGSNMQQRSPAVLVLDSSASMSRKIIDEISGIDALNTAMLTLERDLNNSEAHRGALLSVLKLTDSAAQCAINWTDGPEFNSVSFISSGYSLLHPGVLCGLKMLREQKKLLKTHGISYRIPALVIISGGIHSDSPEEWESMITECRAAETSGEIEVICLGIDKASVSALSCLSSRHPGLLSSVRIAELVWSWERYYYLQEWPPRRCEGTDIDYSGKLAADDPWRYVGFSDSSELTRQQGEDPPADTNSQSVAIDPWRYVGI